MEALEPDLLEAAVYARTMSPEETEETIDHLLNEVLSSSVVIADFSLKFGTEHSTGMTLLVIT